MSDPTVSLVITSYNQKDLLAKALKSSLDQTRDFHQIIVVDDCSTDDSASFLRTLTQQEPQLDLVLHEENGGLSKARNSGLDAVTGDYAVFLDGDDWLVSHACQSITDLLREDRPDLGIYNWQCINDATGELISTLERHPFLTEDGLQNPAPTSDEDIANLFRCQPPAWLKAHSMDFLNRENLRFHGRIYEDLTWHFKTLVRAKSIRCTTERLTYYRIHAQSVLNTKSLRHFDIFDIYEEGDAFMRSQNPLSETVHRMFRRHRFNIMCFALTNGRRIPDDHVARYAQKVLAIPDLTKFDLLPYEQELLEKIQMAAGQAPA